MKDKIGNAILLMILLQLIIACCNEETYQVTITGLDSRDLILDDSNFVEFNGQNPIDKEDLIIEVLINEVEDIVSSEPDKRTNPDIQVLEAAVVPCEDQVVIYANRIEDVTVEVLDADNNDSGKDVTGQMVIQGTQQSIQEYVLENNPGIRGFAIEFSDTSNIPDRITYVIEATLDDGQTIRTSGGIIIFN